MKTLALTPLAVPLVAVLIACGTTPSGTTPPIETAKTIEGKVFLNGVPDPNATVVVDGETPVSTSSDGSFTIEGVEAPYDLTVVDSAAKTSRIYYGLTRGDPIVRLTADPTIVTVPGSGSASVDLTINNIQAASTNTFVGTVGRGLDQWSIFGAPAPLPSTFRLPLVRWTSPTDAHPSAVGVYEVERPTGGSARVVASGRADLTLTDGASLSVAVNLTPVSEWDTVTARNPDLMPAGVTSNLIVFEGIGADGTRYGAIVEKNKSEASYVVPRKAGSRVLVTFNAFTSAGASISGGYVTPGGPPVSFPLPPIGRLDSPSEGETGVGVGSPIAWSGPGGTHEVNLVGSDLRVVIVTTAKSTTIPDLSALGLPMRRGVPGSVVVNSFPSVNTVDDRAPADLDHPAPFSYGSAKKFLTAP